MLERPADAEQPQQQDEARSMYDQVILLHQQEHHTNFHLT